MDEHSVTSPKARAAVPRAARADSAKSPVRHYIDSASLLHGARELIITHHGDSYCLRVTRNEKLILTK